MENVKPNRHHFINIIVFYMYNYKRLFIYLLIMRVLAELNVNMFRVNFSGSGDTFCVKNC